MEGGDESRQMGIYVKRKLGTKNIHILSVCVCVCVCVCVFVSHIGGICKYKHLVRTRIPYGDLMGISSENWSWL